jgi:uncharacterized protein involved in oxidation of intracellular sulfur
VAKTSDAQVRVFLMGDTVGCAVANQKVPDGWDHLVRFVK